MMEDKGERGKDGGDRKKGLVSEIKWSAPSWYGEKSRVRVSQIISQNEILTTVTVAVLKFTSVLIDGSP